MMKGLLTKDKGFMSTTPFGAGGYDVQYIIKVPKGSAGAYIENLSKFPNQREFILDKRSAFKVISKSKNVIELEMMI